MDIGGKCGREEWRRVDDGLKTVGSVRSYHIQCSGSAIWRDYWLYMIPMAKVGPNCHHRIQALRELQETHGH